MKKIYLIESAMEFRWDNPLSFKNKFWSTLYAVTTKEQAEKDVRHHRKGEYLRRKGEIDPCYKTYYRVREINLY